MDFIYWIVVQSDSENITLFNNHIYTYDYKCDSICIHLQISFIL